MSDVVPKSKKTNTPPPPPPEPKDPSEVRVANESNYIQLNRELFYVQELLNSNTSWELEHKITTGSNLKLRGIFTDDDVSFNISNSFGTGGLSDTVLGNVSNAVKNLHTKVTNWTPVANSGADIMGMLGDGISEVTDQVDKLFKGGEGFFQDKEGKSSLGGNWSKGYSDFYNKTHQLFGDIKVNPSRIMNSKFISAVDLVKSFQGTDMKYSLPTMKCWIFHNSQEKKTNVKSMIKAIINTCAGDVSDVEGIVGLQYSPGEYRPEFTKVINQSKYHNGRGFHGTWNLTMGGYTIYNLVISNIDVSMSKFNAIDYDGNDSGDPLYAELSITVEPASFISKRDMIDTLTRRRSTSNSITFHNYDQPSEDASKVKPTPASNKGKVSNGKTSKGGKKSDTEIKQSVDKRVFFMSLVNNPELTKHEKYVAMENFEIHQCGTDPNKAYQAVCRDLDEYSGGTFGVCYIESKWYDPMYHYAAYDKSGKQIQSEDLDFSQFTMADDEDKKKMIDAMNKYINKSAKSGKSGGW